MKYDKIRTTAPKGWQTVPGWQTAQTGLSFVLVFFLFVSSAFPQGALRVDATGAVIGATPGQKVALRESIVGTPVEVGEVNEVWLSLRTDGLAGKGTRLDPLDASTALKFDAIMNASVAGKCYRLHAGTYFTRGFNWSVGFGWKLADGATLMGSGCDKTTLRLTAYPLWWTADPGSKHWVIGNANPTGVGGCVVRDLTVDCNWQNLASPFVNKAVLAVALVGSNNLVERCRFINSYGHLASNTECFVVALVSSITSGAVNDTNNWVRDCEFAQPLGDYSACIILSKGATVGVLNSIAKSGVTGCRAIGDFWTGLANLAYCIDIDVMDNFCDMAKIVHHDTGPAEHIRVKNNTAVNAREPITFNSAGAVSNIEISGNSIEFLNHTVGAHNYGIIVGDPAGVAQYTDVVVKNNVVKRQTTAGGTLYRGAFSAKITNLVATDNVWPTGVENVLSQLKGEVLARNYTEAGKLPAGFYETPLASNTSPYIAQTTFLSDASVTKTEAALAGGVAGFSDVAYNQRTGTVFVVTQTGSAAGNIFELDTNGLVLRQIVNSNFEDPEAICWLGYDRVAGADIFAIAEENHTTAANENRISLVKITPAATTLNRTAVGNVSATTAYSNGTMADQGIEAMCYDSRRKKLLYTAEKQTTAGSPNTPGTGAAVIYEREIFLYFPGLYIGNESVAVDINTILAALLSDISGMAYDEKRDLIVLLSHEGNAMVSVDRKGTQTEFVPLVGTQLEGVAFTPAQDQIWTVGEATEFRRYDIGRSMNQAGNLNATHLTLSGNLAAATLGTTANYINIGGAGGAGPVLFNGGSNMVVSRLDSLGTASAWFGALGLRSTSDGPIGFSNSTSNWTTLDTILTRDAANTLAQRNSTASQTFRVYGTYATAGSDYERLSFFHTNTTGSTIAVESGGTGTANLNLTLLPKGTGSVVANATFRLKSYTVATLPAGTVGDNAYVTDATAPTYLGALTGGGAVVCPVFYNGAAWVSH